MEHSINTLAEKIYYNIKDTDAPWGVGTIAIIAGLGLRLINLALAVSNKQLFNYEEKQFFQLCDEDDRLFNRFLQQEKIMLNTVPLKLLKLILKVLSELDKQAPIANKNVRVDYSIGLAYLTTSTKQIIKIIQDNSFEGTSEEQCSIWLKELEKIIEKSYIYD